MEGKGREGKGREGKGREGKEREGKGREGKGRKGKGRNYEVWNLGTMFSKTGECFVFQMKCVISASVKIVFY